MATRHAPQVPIGEGADQGHAAVQRTWPKVVRLSSLADRLEGFLARSGFDRAPWLVVAFAAGIACWFLLDGPWQWVAAATSGFLMALAGLAMGNDRAVRRGHLKAALVFMGLAFAAGVAVVWIRSEIVGAAPIERPFVGMVHGYVLEREDQPALARTRITLAARDVQDGQARKIRVNVPQELAGADLSEGAIVRVKARLMPPAPPMIPGSYDFARTAWFMGLSATGTAIGPVEILSRSEPDTRIARIQRKLAGHVRSRLGGSPGSIAAAFASGDRNGISKADEEAMRDAGLTHLLSISGLHVSAVIAGGYILTLKLLALWPAAALRLRLPVVAAGAGAMSGIAYTLLTGAEVPTVRSCIGALLVLGALVLGREALTLRMVAVAAFFVLTLWPESLVGPSFQMSFAAVIALVALHGSEAVRSFLAPRDESLPTWLGKRALMLLVTGFVIELALMPIVLFHFHRAGMYGALANVLAIPLVTFVSMPLIAVALVLDLAGLGAPAWWMAGKSLEFLLWLAHFTASQPGSVKLFPQIGVATFASFIAGGLWFALWQSKIRWLAVLPVASGLAMLSVTTTPDILVSGDGRNVGIVIDGERLLSLRQSRSDYARENLLEMSGIEAEPIAIQDWPGARCSPEFCVLTIEKSTRKWNLLLARNRVRIEERALAAACERADIVVSDRWLPSSCRPLWLKADRNLLEQTGGLSIDLGQRKIETVARSQGEHGWWRGPTVRDGRARDQ